MASLSSDVRSMRLSRFKFYGTIIGIFLPIFFIAASNLAFQCKFPLGDNFFTATAIIALGLIEIPPVIIGRALNLPIENGGIAFLIADLNASGYLLVILFYGILGLIIDIAIRTIFYDAKKT